MAQTNLLTTAGATLLAQVLAGDATLDDLKIVLGSGRTAPAVTDTGVTMALSPAVEFVATGSDPEVYLDVDSNGVLQVGFADTDVDSGGDTGSAWEYNEYAVLNDTICILRGVETDTTRNFGVKLSNASGELNIFMTIANPTASTYEVNPTLFAGIATQTKAGRVRINTDGEFAARSAGTIVALTSQIPQPATQLQTQRRQSSGLVEARYLPKEGAVYIPAANVSGTNVIILSPYTNPSANAVGDRYLFEAKNTSSSNVYVNVNSIGNVRLRKEGRNLGSGDIRAGRWYEILYDGAAFEVIGSDEDVALRTLQNVISTLTAVQKETFLRRVAPGVQTLADASNISWNVNNGSIAKVTIFGNRTLNLFTNGIDGAYYELQVTASGGSRTLSLSGSYARGDNDAPAAIDSGDMSILMFKQVGSSRLYIGEKTGYDL